MFKQFDVVRLTRDIEDGPTAGTTVVILDVYTEPTPGYEIEQVGEDGSTIYWGGIGPDDVEALPTD